MVCWGQDPGYPPGERLTDLSIGDYHTCALRHDGGPVCWGYGYDTHTESAERPPLEAMDDNRFTAISSGFEHACALRENGAPICWAWFGYGYLGGEQLVPYGERLASISSGGSHVCGLREDGKAVCWGADWTPDNAPPPDERFMQLSSGYTYVCALSEDGAPFCWGAGEHGEASPPEDERFTTISSSLGLYDRHTCALRQNGERRLLGCGHRWPGIAAGRRAVQSYQHRGTPYLCSPSGGRNCCLLGF